MAYPTAAFNSNSVPFGGFSITLWRTQATPTQIGTYILESCSPTFNAVTIDRPGTDGGDNGFTVVDGKYEGQAVLQLATNATPMPQNGDMFLTSLLGVSSAGSGEAKYFTIINPSPGVSTSDYRKVTCTIRQDKYPTAAMTSTITSAD